MGRCRTYRVGRRRTALSRREQVDTRVQAALCRSRRSISGRYAPSQHGAHHLVQPCIATADFYVAAAEMRSIQRVVEPDQSHAPTDHDDILIGGHVLRPGRRRSHEKGRNHGRTDPQAKLLLSRTSHYPVFWQVVAPRVPAVRPLTSNSESLGRGLLNGC